MTAVWKYSYICATVFLLVLTQHSNNCVHPAQVITANGCKALPLMLWTQRKSFVKKQRCLFLAGKTKHCNIRIAIGWTNQVFSASWISLTSESTILCWSFGARFCTVKWWWSDFFKCQTLSWAALWCFAPLFIVQSNYFIPNRSE